MLDPAERASLSAYLIDQASRFATITADGRKLQLKRIAALPQLGAGGAERLVTTVLLEAPLEESVRSLQLLDRHKDLRIDVPVQVSVNSRVLRTLLPPQPFVSADHPLTLEFR
jgi:hypothetical protein